MKRISRIDKNIIQLINKMSEESRVSAIRTVLCEVLDIPEEYMQKHYNLPHSYPMVGFESLKVGDVLERYICNQKEYAIITEEKMEYGRKCYTAYSVLESRPW